MSLNFDIDLENGNSFLEELYDVILNFSKALVYTDSLNNKDENIKVTDIIENFSNVICYDEQIQVMFLGFTMSHNPELLDTISLISIAQLSQKSKQAIEKYY